jgi:hypothetical protein
LQPPSYHTVQASLWPVTRTIIYRLPCFVFLLQITRPPQPIPYEVFVFLVPQFMELRFPAVVAALEALANPRVLFVYSGQGRWLCLHKH